MDSRETRPTISGFRQQNRQILGSFLRSLEHLDPWWISILSPVNGDSSTTLTSLLGFEHEVGLQFLAGTGLIKSSRGEHPSYSVVQVEWERFIVEEKLQDIMESVNRTSVGRSKFYFINYGKKDRLYHRPIDQFLSKKPLKAKQLFIIERQQKFHRQVSKALVATRFYNISEKEKKEEADNDSSESESESESKEVVAEKIAFVQDCYNMNNKDTPHLAKLLGDPDKVSKDYLNTLLLEMFKVIGSNSNVVNFEYKNSTKGCAIIVPQVKNYDSFKKQAKRSQWIRSLLGHIAGKDSTEDAAQWMITYLGKHYDASFTLASAAIGLPIVERMDAPSAEAMWSDANVNVVQQRIIRRHLRHHFGKRLFIPQTIFAEDRKHYSVDTYYDCFKYYKGGDKLLKPEKCPYWFRDPAEVVSVELAKLLDYTDSNLKATKLRSISLSPCTIVAGADQGQGSWRSWVKVSIESGQTIRERMASELDYDPKSSYIVSQVAHITCKKDHHEILSATVSDALSAGYEKLQSSSLVFIQPPSKKIKAIYVSKHAKDIKLEQDTEDDSKCRLSYFLLSDTENGFSMKHVHKETFDKASTVLLTIPSFSIFITGDLAFYADVLGMPSSSSYWCPWCLLSRPEWQTQPSEPPHERTATFLHDTYQAILQDEQNRLKATEKKGVSCGMHYKSLTPQDFVPPLLHMEIGMVNHAWDDFEQWIDDVVEMVPPHEQDARKEVIKAKEDLQIALSQREEDDKTMNIEIREKSAEVKVLKSELRKAREQTEKEELQITVMMLESMITHLKNSYKLSKDKVKDCQAAYAASKKKLADYKAERGKPEASIVAEIELYLEKLKISRAAYHGGDFNGVCCRRIVGNSKAIADNAQVILKQKNVCCDDTTIHKKVYEIQQLIGLLDAAFAYLNIYYLNEDE